LAQYTIHHQLLSASYNVGGPFAGYALALNTLSTLLFIPGYNDFDITGAPWIKGVKRGESCRVLKFSRKQWGDDRKRIIYVN
jgi:transitional endoplasmic reticulum ATPase